MEYTRKIGQNPGNPGPATGQPDRTMAFATVLCGSADPSNVCAWAVSWHRQNVGFQVMNHAL